MCSVKYFLPALFSLLLMQSAWLSAKQKESDTSKERLTVLLKARSAKFDRYTESINQRSGIFGNQTKKDLKRVNEILMDITQTDNIIFKELKRLLDFKDFEKGSALQNYGAYDVAKARYVAAIDTLNKQLEVLKATKDDLKQQSTLSGFLTFLLCVVLAMFLYFYYKNKKREVAMNRTRA